MATFYFVYLQYAILHSCTMSNVAFYTFKLISALCNALFTYLSDVAFYTFAWLNFCNAIALFAYLSDVQCCILYICVVVVLQCNCIVCIFARCPMLHFIHLCSCTFEMQLHCSQICAMLHFIYLRGCNLVHMFVRFSMLHFIHL